MLEWPPVANVMYCDRRDRKGIDCKVMKRVRIITYGQFAWYEPLLILLMDKLMEFFYGCCGLMKWILKWWLYDVEEKR